jgi:alcohol dehydrogenase class IV
MIEFEFVTPPRTLCGWNAATDGRLAAAQKHLGARPLLVCGHSLRASGALEAVLARLADVGVTPVVHEGVRPEPTVADAQAALEAAWGCDSVLAIGGGSALDVAKAAALAPWETPIAAYFAGAPVPESGGLPILAAPTTAGTGSEATWVSVFVDPDARRKASFRGGAMLPRVVVLDAALTVSCPPTVTASSGMDALVQAIEAYVSRGANRLTDALALEAAILLDENLEAAFRDGENRAARGALLLGSYMAGVALNTARLGLVHGLAHPLGARTGAAHGLLCGLLLPAVIRFNTGSELGKYDDLAVALQTDDLAGRIETLLARLELARPLSALGLTPGQLGATAHEALPSGSTKSNPRPVSQSDALAVLQECF